MYLKKANYNFLHILPEKDKRFSEYFSWELIEKVLKNATVCFNLSFFFLNCSCLELLTAESVIFMNARYSFFVLLRLEGELQKSTRHNIKSNFQQHKKRLGRFFVLFFKAL